MSPTEARPQKNKRPRGPPLFNRQLLGFALAVLVLGVAAAGLTARGEPERQHKFKVENVPLVTTDELARWGVEGRRDYVVVDLRPTDDFQEGHIRGAVSCGTCHTDSDEGRAAEQGAGFIDLTKKLVLITDTGDETVMLPRLLAKNPRLAVLAGGWTSWKREVMAPVAFGGELDEGELRQKRTREAVRAFYAGERPTSSTAVLPVAPIRRQTTHQPAQPTEGC